MAGRKSTGKEAGKADDNAGKSGAGETGRRQMSIKTWMPWLPFVSWIVGAVIVTFLLFIFYKPSPSPTISAAYFVIVLLGFYILWRSKKADRRKSKSE